MNESARARPISLGERVATTVLVPALLWLVDRTSLPFFDDDAAARAGAHVSPLALGLTSLILAFALVEVTALIVPRWRGWRHDAAGRARLERAAVVVGLLMALAQAWGVARSLEDLSLATDLGWAPVAVQTATLVGGVCLMALAARWVTRRGLVNGYVLWWLVTVASDAVRAGALRQAEVRHGGAGASLLVVALAVVVLATVVAVGGGSAIPSAARLDGSAYREGQGAAPRPWFPIPVSSLQPLTCAAALLMFPTVLASMRVPGMADLQAALGRGEVAYQVSFVLLVALGMIAATALLYRPEEVSAVLRRLGAVSDEVARADTRAALRRALLPTSAYLLVLMLASAAIHAESHGLPAAAVLAVATAAAMDLVTSAVAHARAGDLVCVEVAHDAYAVAAVREALRLEGIEARPRGMSALSLLQAFGAYAPAELYVRAPDAERAVALLRHWTSGEARPVAAKAAGVVRAPWTPGARAAALGALGVVALVALLAPRAAAHAAPPAKRAAIALVRVDDAIDPLKEVREEDLPEGVSVLSVTRPLSLDHAYLRSYARAVLRPGEPPQGAWSRIAPWLQQHALPEGERWAWEKAIEADPADEGAEPVFRVVGLQTLVLTGEPVVTSADVEEADVAMDPQAAGRPYVQITLTRAGGERFYALTQEWVGRRLAIVIDDHVESAPVIRSPIRGGRLSITMDTGADPQQQLADAQRLAASLRP